MAAKGQKKQKAGAATVIALERERDALEMRKGGANYLQIGEKLGMTDEGARQCVLRALRHIQQSIAELATDVRSLELERLDRLFLTFYNDAIRGDGPALDRCLRIMERRSKYLGLDAATQIDVSGPGGGPIVYHNLTDAELAEELAATEAALAEARTAKKGAHAEPVDTSHPDS